MVRKGFSKFQKFPFSDQKPCMANSMVEFYPNSQCREWRQQGSFYQIDEEKAFAGKKQDTFVYAPRVRISSGSLRIKGPGFLGS